MLIDVFDLKTDEEALEHFWYCDKDKSEADSGGGHCCHVACIDNINFFPTRDLGELKPDFLACAKSWAKNGLWCSVCERSMQYAPVSITASKRILRMQLI